MLNIAANNDIGAAMYTYAISFNKEEYIYYNTKEYVGWLILLANIKKEYTSELTHISMLKEEKKYVSITDDIKYYFNTEYVHFCDEARRKLRKHYIDWRDIDGITPIYRDYQIDI